MTTDTQQSAVREEVKPALWQIETSTGWVRIDEREVDYFRKHGRNVRPLYASPPLPDREAKLVEAQLIAALREYLSAIDPDTFVDLEEAAAASAKLRSALALYDQHKGTQ